MPRSIFASEIVGCKIILNSGSNDAKPAAVAAYDTLTSLHTLITEDGSSIQMNLKETRFTWVGLPSSIQQPNPSYKFGPTAMDAVGKHLKIYWPSMMKWYPAFVSSYDPITETHLVLYEDGESANIDLRHESVTWVCGTALKRKKDKADADHVSEALADDDCLQASAAGSSKRIKPSKPPKPSKPFKAQRKAPVIKGSADDSDMKRIVQSRIILAWDWGKRGRDKKIQSPEETLLRGKIASYAPADGRHRVRYDDQTSRLVTLNERPFAWVSPRSKSAGYSSDLHQSMAKIGALNILPLPAAWVPPSSSDLPTVDLKLNKASFSSLPSSYKLQGSQQLDVESVGRQLVMFWPGDGRWYPGQVVAAHPGLGHKVLFADGETEFVDLSQEVIAWAGEEVKEFGASFPLGVICDLASPVGDEAIGWRVELLMEASSDCGLVSGIVRGVDTVSGEYLVAAAVGGGKMTQEVRVPQKGMIVWRAAPSVIPGAFSSTPEVMKILPAASGTAAATGTAVDPPLVTPTISRLPFPLNKKKAASSKPKSQAKPKARKTYKEDSGDDTSDDDLSLSLDDGYNSDDDDEWPMDDSDNDESEDLETRVLNEMETWLDKLKPRVVAGLIFVSPDEGERRPAAVVVQSSPPLLIHPLFASISTYLPVKVPEIEKEPDLVPELEREQEQECLIQIKEAPPSIVPYFRPHGPQVSRRVSLISIPGMMNPGRSSSVILPFDGPFWRERVQSTMHRGSELMAMDLMDVRDDDELGEMLRCIVKCENLMAF